MDKELNEKYSSQMNELKGNNDIEMVHSKADDILCNLLNDLGYNDLVDTFKTLEKWYA